MNLTKFPRRVYSREPTPIHKLERLSNMLGGPKIYIKRDDMFGIFNPGGNKTRKLEYLMGDAIAQGCDTIITCGAVQSNHARLALVAAITEGMDCHLILEQRVPNSYNKSAGGNNFHYELLGATSITPVEGGADLMAIMTEKAQALSKQGKKPYIIPTGGSNEVGTIGYVASVLETMWQLHQMNLTIDNIVLTSGSSGTHAGTLVGLHSLGMKIPVTGICISRKAELQKPVVQSLIERTAAKIGTHAKPTPEDVVVFDDYVGDGYSRGTKGMAEAVKLLARTEAIILDSVYTGKTMDGLLDLYRQGYFNNCENILFIHTGGASSLYEYKDQVLSL